MSDFADHLTALANWKPDQDRQEGRSHPTRAASWKRGLFLMGAAGMTALTSCGALYSLGTLLTQPHEEGVRDPHASGRRHKGFFDCFKTSRHSDRTDDYAANSTTANPTTMTVYLKVYHITKQRWTWGRSDQRVVQVSFQCDGKKVEKMFNFDHTALGTNRERHRLENIITRFLCDEREKMDTNLFWEPRSEPHGLLPGLLRDWGGEFEVFYTNEGDRYEGQWLNNQRSGWGICDYHDRDRYEGYWLNGKHAGKGTYKWADGESYEGGYSLDGKRSGRGVYKFKNGDKYDGSWLDGEQSGWGTLTFAHGGRYEGQFHNDLQHGHGTCTSSDGRRKYEGVFGEGRPAGWTKEQYEGWLNGGSESEKAADDIGTGFRDATAPPLSEARSERQGRDRSG